MRDARAREERDALARAVHAADAADRIVATPDATLKTIDRVLRDAREALGTLEHLPHTPNRDLVRQRLEAARTSLGPRAQELRDADDWQRWANASVQEQLIAKMEALAAVEDPADAARQLRELQESGRRSPPARASRVRRSGGGSRPRIDEVVRRAPMRSSKRRRRLAAEHLQRKLALCERAEALADSTDWIATADAIKALQAEWKTIGPGPRKEEQAAWERFRTACDRFFTRRHEDLAQRKQPGPRTSRGRRRSARGRDAADRPIGSARPAELKRLQAEWKTIGPVRKNKSEAIWQRFRAACDRFFERYKQRHILDLNVRLAAREALIAEAVALSRRLRRRSRCLPQQSGACCGGRCAGRRGRRTPRGRTEKATVAVTWLPKRMRRSAPPETHTAAARPRRRAAPQMDRVAAVRSLRTRWANAPVLPRDVLAPLAQRFEAALAAAVGADPDAVRGTEFDVTANLRRLHELVSRAEQLAGPEPARRDAVSPRLILATQLREALAANTIGGRAG